jgi:serine/threonine-protein kinase
VFRNAFVRCPLDGAGLEPLEQDPLEGETFAERYIIERCVGEGATGRVYRARHHKMSRTFAIKVLFGDQASNTKMQSRFAREAEAAARLSHPNVVKVVDFGEDKSGLLYLVMEHVEGRSLAEIVDEEAPLGAKRSKKIALQLAAGLGHAHDHGLVHRDFKTDNVLITMNEGEEVAKILDFGIAVLLEEKHKQSKLTTEGIVLGTPAFMSPEQAIGDEIDHRADLFSLGIILYELLAGVHPFGGTPLEIARKNLSLEFPAISKRVPGLEADMELEAVAFKLLEKRPDDRYQTGKELIAALESVDTSRVMTPRALLRVDPPSFTERENESASPVMLTEVIEPLRPERRWPRTVLFGVAAIAVAAVGYMLGGRDQGEPEPVAAAEIRTTAPAPVEPVEPAPADPPSVETEATMPAPDNAVQPPAKQRPPRAAIAKSEAKRRHRKAADKSAKKAASRDTKHQAAPPAPAEVTTSAFTGKFSRVGKLVHRLSSGAESKKLRKSYMSIPFADALKNGDVRRDAMRKLKRIESRANKLLAN